LVLLLRESMEIGKGRERDGEKVTERARERERERKKKKKKEKQRSYQCTLIGCIGNFASTNAHS